jgi:LacI family transcriptional regulator
MVTMQDVAKQAGVSVSTVSRVVNGREYVSDDVRRRVMVAIRQLGYQPNLLAQSLVKGRETRQIGLLVYDISNLFFAEIALAVEDVAYRNNYTVILCNCAGGRDTERYLDMFFQRKVDGVALAAGELTREEITKLAQLTKNRIPVIIYREKGWPIKDNLDYAVKYGFGVVEIDSMSGAQMATEHLISMGHKEIAVLFGPPQKHCASDPRLIGYKNALEVHGLSFKESSIVTGLGYNQLSGARGIRELVQKNLKATAVLAYNDLVAIGALASCREQNLKVPENISIVGFDNIKGTEFYNPPLTTVDIPKKELGELMAQYILDKTQNEEQTLNITLPTQLIIRQSTNFILK